VWIDLTGLDWIQSPSGVLQCSASCGKGTQKRTVTCTNSQGKCDASTRPRAEEPCEDYSGCYEWKTGSWSKVSMVPARPSCPEAEAVQGLSPPTVEYGACAPILPGSGGASGAQPSHILPGSGGASGAQPSHILPGSGGASGAQPSHRGPQFNQMVPVSPAEFTLSPNSTPAGDPIWDPLRRALRTPKTGKSAKGTHASCSGFGHQPLREPPQRLGVCPQADTEVLWADRASLSPEPLGEGWTTLDGKAQGPGVRKGGHLPEPQGRGVQQHSSE